MRIAEIFHSLQGEGIHVGEPSIFVRAAGCNLRCAWCDTPYASWNPQGDQLNVEEIVDRVRAWHKTSHVVLTGGEPLIAPDLPKLSAALQATGHIVTIETAGTVFVPGLRPDLFSLSPKLGNSVPGIEQPAARQIHLRNNTTRHLEQFVASGCDYQVKFVIQGEEDTREMLALINHLEIPRHRVFLMPEGATVELFRARAEAVAAICLREGLRYSGRLHLDLWNGARGH